MDELGKHPDRNAELRRQAEAVARDRAAEAREPHDRPSPVALERTLHELRVHQIELELQNEELRRAQVELEILRTRYFDLYDLAPVGYLSLDEQGLILEANLAAAILLDLPRNELVGQRLSRFIPPEEQDRYYFHRMQVEASVSTRTLELRMLKQSGPAFWAHLAAVAARDAEGAFVCRVTLSDVSGLRQAEEERLAMTERMGQAAKLEALGVLVSGVAHNINNTLAIVLGHASLREELTTDVAELAADRIIVEACRRARDVVRSLIQFAQPTLASQAPLDLHQVLRELSVLLEHTTQNRIRIVATFAPEPAWVHGDAGSLRQVLMSLCLNALDAMPGAGTLTLRTAVPEPDWVEVAVEDDGAGMVPEVLSRALEPFFTTKPVGQGTGLGLSMSHGVVKAHGGTLAIASAPGQGTTVTLRLPRIPALPQEMYEEERLDSPRPLRVLLVDDDADVRFLVARMLTKAGLQVDAVPGGREALDRLGSEPLPDLVVLDQNMPGLDGSQTLERLRALYPKLPVLISSGQPGIEEWACFQQPNVAVISKPFEVTELLSKLARFLP